MITAEGLLQRGGHNIELYSTDITRAFLAPEEIRSDSQLDIAESRFGGAVWRLRRGSFLGTRLEAAPL